MRQPLCLWGFFIAATTGAKAPSISENLMMEISLFLHLSEPRLPKASLLHAVNSITESIQRHKNPFKGFMRVRTQVEALFSKISMCLDNLRLHMGVSSSMGMFSLVDFQKINSFKTHFICLLWQWGKNNFNEFKFSFNFISFFNISI